jgi:L-fucose isomerase-like protein
MFASSKVLGKLHAPFTYVENCRVDDPQFRDGVSRFLRAAMVVKSMKRMRIGQVGVRVDFFWTTIDNESELLERFGIQLLPFDMVDFLKAVKARAKKDRAGYLEELSGLKRQWLDLAGMRDEEGVLNALAYRDELFRLGEENDLDAFSIQSFSSIPDELGAGVGIGEMMLQEWYPIGAESDIHGAVSSVLVEAAASEEQPSFFPEYTVRHPTNDNAVLLWHGVAPLSLRHPEAGRVSVGAPWILKGLPPSSPQFRLRDGPLTVCRFDGDTGGYRLGVGQGRTVPGPATNEFYAWMEVDDWPHWERQIMQGPYIHHCSAVYDHCADVLEEACRYIPHLAVERFDRPERKG